MERGPLQAGSIRIRRRGIVFHAALHGSREIRAVPFAGEPQRHIDARRHAGGGNHIAVAHIAMVGQSAASLRARNVSTKAQWVVTFLPFAGPAAVSSIAPVHTLVIHRASFATFAIQPSKPALLTSRRVPCPPGTSSTSSAAHFSVMMSGRTRMPLAQRMGESF